MNNIVQWLKDWSYIYRHRVAIREQHQAKQRFIDMVRPLLALELAKGTRDEALQYAWKMTRVRGVPVDFVGPLALFIMTRMNRGEITLDQLLDKWAWGPQRYAG